MEILNELPPRGTGSGQKPRYPWDEWMDGKPRLAERGVDYHIADQAFALLIRQKARRCGMIAAARKVPRGVAFQITAPVEELDTCPGTIDGIEADCGRYDAHGPHDRDHELSKPGPF